MEQFYNYLRRKHFVDYENEEIKDIGKAMDICMRQIVEVFNKVSPVLQIDRLEPCGSMQEHTTVWGEENLGFERFGCESSNKTMEFDCLAVLKPVTEDMTIEHSCAGYRKLSSEKLSLLLQDKERIEQSERFQQAMTERQDLATITIRELLLSESDSNASVIDRRLETQPFNDHVTRIIQENIESGQDVSNLQELLKFHKFVQGASKTVSVEFSVIVEAILEGGIPNNRQNNPFQVEVSSGFLQYQSCYVGCQLSFTWKSKTRLLDAEEIRVYADFVPAFQVQPQDPELSKSESTCPNFLVAKRCHNAGCESGCWRLSHCLDEIQTIQQTSQAHRDVYKILKLFNYSILKNRVDNSLKSYHLKTALLKHTLSCKRIKENVTECLCEVLEVINGFVAARRVPHWKDPYYFLELKLDSCHRFTPMLLLYIFGDAVTSCPLRLRLTIGLEAGISPRERLFSDAGYILSDIVCQIIEGADGNDYCERLETEIENTLMQAADLIPLMSQFRIQYFIIIEVILYNRRGQEIIQEAELGLRKPRLTPQQQLEELCKKTLPLVYSSSLIIMTNSRIRLVNPVCQF